MYSKAEVEKFARFLLHSDRGVIGIREDAPEEAKEAYAKFKAAKEEAAKKGIKL